MTKDHKDRPRQQHYDFVNHALPEIFFKNPDSIFNSFRNDGDVFLNYLWGKLGQYSQEAEEDQLKIKSELIISEHFDLIKITLPKPEHDHEAYAVVMALIKQNIINFRYFVFDYRSVNDKYENIIGEWIGEKYLKLTKIDSKDVEDFTEYIRSII
jgi:hypothetical protein